MLDGDDRPSGEQSPQGGAVLRLLIELCAQFVGAEEGSLLVVDRRDDPPEALRFEMTVGSHESERVLLGQRVLLGEGLVGLAAVTHEVQLGAPGYDGIVQARRGDTPSGQPSAVLAAPVLAHDELIGVITAVRFAPGERFTREQAVLYGRAAAVAGLVLDQQRRLAVAESQGARGQLPGGPWVGRAIETLAGRTDAERAALVDLLEVLFDLVRGTALTLTELLELDPRALVLPALRPVEVALLDTGVDSRHPDLREAVVDSYALVRSGPRFRASRREPPCANDPIGHGTGVASTIAAIAPNARIVDIQVASADKVGTGEALLAGLRLAIERGCPLVNLSLACHPRLLQPLVELCEVAYFRNQVLVAARRNMPLVDHGLPAQLSSVIGVDAADVPSPFELRYRYNHPIEFTARGDELVVAAPGGGYTVQAGASYASSTVAGLCALYLGRDPELTPYEMKALLKGLAERTV